MNNIKSRRICRKSKSSIYYSAKTPALTFTILRKEMIRDKINVWAQLCRSYADFHIVAQLYNFIYKNRSI